MIFMHDSMMYVTLVLLIKNTRVIKRGVHIKISRILSINITTPIDFLGGGPWHIIMFYHMTILPLHGHAE